MSITAAIIVMTTPAPRKLAATVNVDVLAVDRIAAARRVAAMSSGVFR